MTKSATEDGWVLGRRSRAARGSHLAELNQLRRDVLGLYLDDYARRWDALLANIALKPFTEPAAGPGRALSCCRRRIRRCATC